MQKDRNKTGIIIVGHGSHKEEANEVLFDIVASLKLRLGVNLIEPAFFSIAQPDLLTSIDRLVAMGCSSILIHPFFLFRGNHTSRDIPRILGESKLKYPKLKICLQDPLGLDPRLVDILEEKILLGRPQTTDPRPQQDNSLGMDYESLSVDIHKEEGLPRTYDPKKIEMQSMEIIKRSLSGYSISEEHLPIVSRVIHATGDFDFVRTLKFHKDSVKNGKEALRSKCLIITDVLMVKVGITRWLGNKVLCKISKKGIRGRSKRLNITRAALAMESLAPFMDGSLIAIGNAPTALEKVIELIRVKKIRPALVVGVPVGLVGASKAKKELEKLDMPYITNYGPKGGSPVAAAIVNALILSIGDSRFANSMIRNLD